MNIFEDLADDDLPMVALQRFHQRIDRCLENYTRDLDDPDVEPGYWTAVVAHEAMVLFQQGPRPYLLHVALSNDEFVRADLDHVLATILDSPQPPNDANRKSAP